MNGRILKLFTQACYHGDYEPENVPNAVVEKFAELIIRECARVASDYDGAHYVGTEIEQHFGVRE